MRLLDFSSDFAYGGGFVAALWLVGYNTVNVRATRIAMPIKVSALITSA